MNENIEHRRKELLEEYADARYARFQMRSLEDYDRLRQVVEAQRKTGSPLCAGPGDEGYPGPFQRGERIPLLHQGRSRRAGSTCWTSRKTVCLPGSSWSWPAFWRTPPAFTAVNSSSPPIPLPAGPAGAKIYDLDQDPVEPCRWTQVPSVRTFYEFFRSRREEFEDENGAPD